MSSWVNFFAGMLKGIEMMEIEKTDKVFNQ